MKEEVVVDRLGGSRVKEIIKTRFGSYPSVTTALFIIGLQEIGMVLDDLSKEEKQDVIHVAVCALMEMEGFYTRTGVDKDGWPHFEATEKIDEIDIDNQENFIKTLIIKYFKDVA